MKEMRLSNLQFIVYNLQFQDSRLQFMILEAKRKALYGKGLKILTPKQMLQRLPIALAQVKK